ncbi:MAG: hypothetical protein J0H57_02380, partial [Rhodospirillales bacterium]|nr:hypothetical protein [Rhodospirillales bacterium]
RPGRRPDGREGAASLPPIRDWDTMRLPVMHSLHARLLVLWLLSLLACAVVGVLLVQLYQVSNVARVGQAEAVIARACDLVRDRYAFYVAGWHGPVPPGADARLRTDLTAVVSLALAPVPEVEGGIWQQDTGSLAYAYPTYPGSGPKTDLPQAEAARIQAVNERAVADEQHVSQMFHSASEALLLEACPLRGPIPGLSAWTMTRVQAAFGYGRLSAGLGALAILVVGSAVCLTALVVDWSRRVRSIESGLAEIGREMPALSRTGSRELDRIVDALNEAGRRLAEQRRRAEHLAERVAASERLAALGRVAGGIAHEIRNPLAAMRLRAENALASPDIERPRRALADILDQIVRLNRLVTELLAMTQRGTPRPVPVALETFLDALVARHADAAAAEGVTLTTDCGVDTAVIDPEMVGRILDNLLQNAVRHTQAGGRVWVRVTAGASDDRLRFIVADTGPGVPPDLQATMFEPFVTGRADGTGLGLAIARELAMAHGGDLRLMAEGDETPGQGAAFVLDLSQAPAQAIGPDHE